MGAFTLAAALATGCMPNDRPWPDVFEDFDARGRLPDGFAFDLVRVDAVDATDSMPESSADSSDGSTLDAPETAPRDVQGTDGDRDASLLDVIDDRD